MEARMPSSLPFPSHPRRPSFSLSLLDSTSPYAHAAAPIKCTKRQCAKTFRVRLR
ncbi:hypothetical protein M422DRAFT_35670 [Sphaerobolus stellatus SS14]|uniref:Uncharacterized protein n=1 Tax=Sphaerobolus stellatus (strain SS14) TaxID=990650 RepID=A0A0C9V665_SPHS4|nr:hypothetical protein M422DRAFT_35670 [Sphaerobolus stellatus SS14]